MPIDPKTGIYHADPMWQRYQPAAPSAQALGELQNLQMPEAPGSPYKPQPLPLEQRAGPDEFSSGPETPWAPPAQPKTPDQGWQDPVYKNPMGSRDIELPSPRSADALQGLQMPNPPAAPPWGVSRPPQSVSPPRGVPNTSIPAGPKSGGELPANLHTPVPPAHPSGYPVDDVNQRADAIINDPMHQETGLGGGTHPAMAGLQAAGDVGTVQPTGGVQAEADWRKLQPTALSALTGGQDGAMGPNTMSPDLASFTKLLSARRPGMPAQDEDRLNQAIQREIGSSAAVSQGLSDERDKTRREALEEEKLRQPVGLQKNLFEQQMALDKARGERESGLQQLKGEQAIGLAETKGQQVSDFWDNVARARMSGQDVSGVTAPGGGGHVSFAPDRGISPALTGGLTKYGPAVVGKDATDWFGNPTQDTIARDTAFGAIMAKAPHQIPPEVLQHMSDEYHEHGNTRPMSEWLTMTDLTPEEQAAVPYIQKQWMAVGGRP